MHRFFCLAALLGVAASAHADDFSTRVSKAKRVERSPEGLAYLMKMTEAKDDEMEQFVFDCFPTGPKGGAPETVELIADVQADGSLANVAVQPVHPRSQCYADKHRTLRVLPPPEKWAKGGFPMYIELVLR